MNPLYIFDYLQIVYRAYVISILSAIYTWGEVHFQQREKRNFIFQIVTLIITNYKKKVCGCRHVRPDQIVAVFTLGWGWQRAHLRSASFDIFLCAHCLPNLGDL